MIAIIDYGMGNIHSVRKVLELYGARALVTNNAGEISAAEKIVLPGVGAFDDAMLELEKRGLVSLIKKEIKAGKPFLGICLGMQLLFDRSQEASKTRGLGVIKGEVKKFDGLKQKVPHMGWNQLKDVNPGCALLNDIPVESYVYFCHSYYPEPADKSVNAASCDYGIKFSAAISKDNVFGVQFHPEKSQRPGLKMLENFVKVC